MKSACISIVVSGVLICACTRIPYALGLRCVSNLHSVKAFAVSIVFHGSTSSIIKLY